AIFGAAPISGKLPVDLSADLKRGQGIDRVKRKRPSPSERTFDFSEASAVLDSAIRDSIFPGAQVMVTKAGEVLWSYQTGRQTYDRDSPPVSGNTIYDLASLTKVVATTPVIMKLVEMKLLPLDEPVSHFLPEFSGNGREKVLIRNLLTHSSGLAPYIQFFAEGIPPEEVLPHILRSSLTYPPGDSTAYSDLGMMVLGAVIEKATGKTLDVLSRDWFFRPLDMSLTMYNPGPEYLEDIAPTEVDPVYRRGLVHGVVHDRNAWWLGGVAPHAGLFSTAGDLARYAQMMMDGGFLEGRRYFKRSTVAEFTRRQNIPPGSERAMGWDTPSDTLSSAGDFFSPGSYGHNGFTGTSLWIDPNDRIAVILLTNRVYPTRERGGMYGVRRRFHNAVMKTVKAP
ncbi:MAG: serine hydrolase domain-containing protein, partial [Fidelibacterota bacterium]